jgi:hypothetical protein
MFRTRVRAIKSGEVPAKYFKAYTGQQPAERTITFGRMVLLLWAQLVYFFVI